jgi:hypothetical protein
VTSCLHGTPRGTDYVSKNRLRSCISKFIMEYCCPHVPRGSNKFVQRFTEFISDEGDQYRGHPNNHGKRWCDHAMINWNLEFPLLALIRTFVDLRHLPDSIRIRTNRQSNLTAGKYAVLESFNAEDSDPAVFDNGMHIVINPLSVGVNILAGLRPPLPNSYSCKRTCRSRGLGNTSINRVVVISIMILIRLRQHYGTMICIRRSQHHA